MNSVHAMICISLKILSNFNSAHEKEDKHIARHIKLHEQEKTFNILMRNLYNVQAPHLYP